MTTMAESQPQHLAVPADQRPYASMDGTTINEETAAHREKQSRAATRKPRFWWMILIFRSFVITCCIVSLVLIICAYGADMERIQRTKTVAFNVPVICLALIWNGIYITSTRLCSRTFFLHWFIVAVVEGLFLIAECVFAGLMGSMVSDDTATQWDLGFMSILIVLVVLTAIIIGFTSFQRMHQRRAVLY